MSSAPKTAKALTRRGALAGGSLASGAEIGAAQHRFHQCLGLLKKHPSKGPPARPISTSIYAIKWPKACFPVRLKGRFPALAKFRTARCIDAAKDGRSPPRSGASKASVLYGGEATRESHGEGAQKVLHSPDKAIADTQPGMPNSHQAAGGHIFTFVFSRRKNPTNYKAVPAGPDYRINLVSGFNHIDRVASEAAQIVLVNLLDSHAVKPGTNLHCTDILQQHVNASRIFFSISASKQQ
jgi:hypothetical protein